MFEQWRQMAACRGMDPEIFYPPDGNDVPARAICRRCPVMLHCDNEADLLREDDGVWGGRLRGFGASGDQQIKRGSKRGGCSTCGGPVEGGLVKPDGRWCSIACFRADPRRQAG